MLAGNDPRRAENARQDAMAFEEACGAMGTAQPKGQTWTPRSYERRTTTMLVDLRTLAENLRGRVTDTQLIGSLLLAIAERLEWVAKASNTRGIMLDAQRWPSPDSEEGVSL
jgi:hypothetical protein